MPIKNKNNRHERTQIEFFLTYILVFQINLCIIDNFYKIVYTKLNSIMNIKIKMKSRDIF
jgi:hypothetical protein